MLKNQDVDRWTDQRPRESDQNCRQRETESKKHLLIVGAVEVVVQRDRTMTINTTCQQTDVAT